MKTQHEKESVSIYDNYKLDSEIKNTEEKYYFIFNEEITPAKNGCFLIYANCIYCKMQPCIIFLTEKKVHFHEYLCTFAPLPDVRTTKH